MKYKNIAFLFPGQGAQHPGMGKDFLETFPVAKQTFEEADDILKRKLSEIVLAGPESALTETKNSQVGIFVTSIAILRVLKELYPFLEPNVAAGLSLGEYTALHASKRLEFSKALEIVQKRASLMNDACEKTKGTMAVIIGLEAEAVEEAVKEVNLPEELWVANYNCPGQVVISGTLRGVEKGMEAAKNRGARRAMNIAVHGAFHSGLMKEAELGLKETLLDAPIKESPIDIVMNVVGDYVHDVLQIKQNLVKQVCGSVRWEQGVRCMAAHGVDLFLEIGPGEVLTGFNKKLKVEGNALNVAKVSDLGMLETLLKN